MTRVPGATHVFRCGYTRLQAWPLSQPMPHRPAGLVPGVRRRFHPARGLSRPLLLDRERVLHCVVCGSGSVALAGLATHRATIVT